METEELRIQIIEALWEAWLKWKNQTTGGTPGEFFQFLFEYRHTSYVRGQQLTKEKLAPVLEAAFAQHLADEAIVTRTTLGLLERLCEQRGDDTIHIVIYKKGGGTIASSVRSAATGFGPGTPYATADAAIESLLKPEEPDSDPFKQFTDGLPKVQSPEPDPRLAKPEPVEDECECCQCDAPIDVTVEICGVPDLNGATMTFGGREYLVFAKPE